METCINVELIISLLSNKTLPPGQHETKQFPILHAGEVPRIPKEHWSLKVYGLVENPTEYSYEHLLNMPKTEIVADIHCVTGWSKFETNWLGVKLTDVFKDVKFLSNAKFLVFESEGGWTTSLPIEVIDERSIVAYRYDGKEIESAHGGPVRTVIPSKYFYKSAKWIKRIKFIERDEIGFWEMRGYSNTADPLKDDRYSSSF